LQFQENPGSEFETDDRISVITTIPNILAYMQPILCMETAKFFTDFVFTRMLLLLYLSYAAIFGMDMIVVKKSLQKIV
jgi:hypothetical protein